MDRWPSVQRSHRQVIAYADSWRDHNAEVLAQLTAGAGRPLWVVLGDSAAQGVGCSRYDGGYVGQLHTVLGPAWAVLNLSRSGARTRDVLREQLPAWVALGRTANLVTALVGANDLTHTDPLQHAADARALCSALPRGAVVATMPRGWRERRAGAVDAVVRAEAAANGLRLADLAATTGPPYRGRYSDGFHPNDRGYARWADALVAALRSDPLSQSHPAGACPAR